MKFTVILTLLPVVLAIPNLKRAACDLPAGDNVACIKFAEKCAEVVRKDLNGVPPSQVPEGFNANKFAICLAASTCMTGGPIGLRQSCIGQEFPFSNAKGFPKLDPNITMKITNGCSGDDCRVTVIRYLMHIYDQLSLFDWPQGPAFVLDPEFVLKNWWAPIVRRVSPAGIADPAHTAITVRQLNDWWTQIPGSSGNATSGNT